MHRNDSVTVAWVALVALLVCSPFVVGHAADSVIAYSWITDSWTDVSDRLQKGISAQDNDSAKMEAARAIQIARFKAHPEQLKNPKRCDNILLRPNKNIPDIFNDTKFWASWRLLAACQDVSGITGHGDGPSQEALKAVSQARQAIEIDALADKWQSSLDDDNKREKARIDREYEENSARITREALQDLQKDQKTHTSSRATYYHPDDSGIDDFINPSVTNSFSNSGGATYGVDGHGGYFHEPGTPNVPLTIGERLNAPGNGPDSGKTIGERLNGPYYGGTGSGE